MRNLLVALFLLFCLNGFGQTNLDSLKQEVKRDVRAGKYEQAQLALESNFTPVCHDTNGLFDALINLCIFEKDWNTILKAYTLHKCRPEEDTTSLTLARYYAKHAEEKLLLTHSTTIPFKPSSSGTPVIAVKINGKTYHFWFDTGAGITVLSSEAAKDCRVRSSRGDMGVAMAATGTIVGLSPALIDTLQIGDLKVYNHPCAILSKKDLEFRILGIRVLKIDGIIGWNLLEELDVTVDNKKLEITLAPAGESKGDATNFYWLSQPFIACTDSAAKVPYIFFLDTGANAPGVYDAFMKKADSSKAIKKMVVIGSAGGYRRMNTYVYPLVKLQAGGQLLILKDITQEPYQENKLFDCDGVLGINEFRNRSIHFNIKTGFFTVSN